MDFSNTSKEKDTIRENLSRNLALARKACGITQEQLAEISQISRATIAQLESGEGDPKMSTIIDLAIALETSPLILFLGECEINAIKELGTKIPEDILSADDLEKMHHYFKSGILKQKSKVAQIGADAAKAAGLSAVGGAIGSILLPGIGTVIGACLGALISSKKEKP